MKQQTNWTTTRGLCAVGLISGIILAFATNLSLPYEQDQPAKAGKIIYLFTKGAYFNPTQGPHFYSDRTFSLYYTIASLFCRWPPLNIYGSMNVLSVLFGIAFMVGLAYALRQAFEVDYWETVVVFWSMPVLLLTYSYGNEAALAFAFVVLSMAAATTDWRLKNVISALLFAAGVFCRADAIFLGPFWLAWVGLYGGEQSKSAVLRRVAWAAGSCTVFGLLFWIVIMRCSLPETNIFFAPFKNLKLILANLVYPFCPTVVLLAFLAFPWLLLRKIRGALIVLLCLLPVVFYLRLLISPKYIIGVTLLYGIPAVLLIHHLKSYWKAAAVSVVLAWWIVSVSPFGVKGPWEGRYWTLPTADGQIPTGAYLTFYDLARRGHYQEQYVDEIASQEAAARYMLAHKEENPVLFGVFNGQFMQSILSQRGYFKTLQEFSVHLSTAPPPPTAKRILMVRFTLLRTEILSPELFDWITEALQAGRVRQCSTDEAIMPGVVEIGPSVPAGTNIELGQRILFLRQYNKGNGAFLTDRPAACYKPLWWVRRAAGQQYEGLPEYEDSQFLGFSHPVPGAEAWRTRFPFVYYSEAYPGAVRQRQK